MKKNAKWFFAGAFALTTLFSCKKQDDTPTETIPTEVINKISAMGYSTHGVIALNGGYVVESDIYIAANELGVSYNKPLIHVGETEQYRTTNLVSGLPRTITVSIQNSAPIYTAALDTAIARYNALGLRIRFQRVSANATISIVSRALGATGVLAFSSGFPRDNGDPADSVIINSQVSFGNVGANIYGTLLAHEIGHCIGFRHTDYKDRRFSCGFTPPSKPNEGATTVGAVYIPGTPRLADAESWMLACSSATNRPFNANDVIALNYLYR